MDNDTHLILRYQNNSLRKDRRTHYDFVVVYIIWCIFTVLACSAFVILVHKKSNEDMVSKAAIDIRKLEVQLQENLRSMVREEVRIMIREELTNCATGNRDGPTQGKPVYSSSAELTLTKETNANADTALKTSPINVDGEIRKTDDEILSHEASSKSKAFKRGAVVQTSSISESVTDSVAGRSNHFLTRIEDSKENQMFNERNLRSDPTSVRSDAMQVADSRVTNDVPLRVKRSSGDSRMKIINIKDEDEGVIVKCSDHVRLNSSELNGEGRKSSAPSKLIEETRCPEIEVVAAHFGADSSSFKTQKIFYRQNNLVSHPTGEYQQWKVDKWYHDLHMFKHVNFTSVGTIIVQKKGLYFVYGQVHFTEWTDSNGFTILKNNEAVYRCVTSSNGSKTVKELVSNTCFTGGLVSCQKGDELKVKGLYPGRQVVFDPTDTFFGMFKLSEGSWSGG